MPVCAGYPNLEELVRATADWVQVFPGHPGDEAELVERMRGAEVILHFFAAGALPTRCILEAAPRRVSVAGPAGGCVDVRALEAAGIEVRQALGEAARTVAEFTIALVLAASHRVVAGALRPGAEWAPQAGRDVQGRTIGVIGWGRIGEQVARLAGAIGMRVLAWSPSLDATTAARVGARRCELDELLAETDVVTLHLRSSPRSRGLLDAERLSRLQPHAILVNTARADLLDMVAVRRMLASGALGGVALDVFDAEPLPPDDVLRSHPGALLTPHMAWMTDDAVERFLVAALTDGGPLESAA
jgi:phosphoglycerate dehydrogenase-like enzyme